MNEWVKGTMTANEEPSRKHHDKPVTDDLPGPCAATLRQVHESSDEASSSLSSEELERLTSDIVAALKTVYDPEIPVDIYELGLIYRVDISDERAVSIDMTLTAPGCPVAGDMPIWVENAVAAVVGISMVEVHMVFDPPWDMSRMTEEARFALNMF